MRCLFPLLRFGVPLLSATDHPFNLHQHCDVVVVVCAQHFSLCAAALCLVAALRRQLLECFSSCVVCIDLCKTG